jgi:hypothetical protein
MLVAVRARLTVEHTGETPPSPFTPPVTTSLIFARFPLAIAMFLDMSSTDVRLGQGYRVLSRLVTDPEARTAGQDPWKADLHAWRMLLLKISRAGESPRAGVLRKRDEPLPCETVPPGTVSPSTTNVCTARPENDRNVITSIANKGGTSMFLTEEGAATSGKGDAVRVDGAVTASRLTVRSQARLLRGIRGSSASDVQLGTPLVAARPGFPPICAAAQAGRVRMVALLLASGAHPDTAVVAGAAPSALHLAAAGICYIFARCFCQLVANAINSACRDELKHV